MTRSLPIRMAGAVAALLASVGAPALAAPEIAYEEIVAAPDDLQLSYRYARQEARNGNLTQAAGALERLLLLQPNWDSARLFYGVVLYRLGDMKGAQREFDKLEGRPLTSAQHEERIRYRQLAAAKARSTRVTGSLSLGMRVDGNPGLASSSDTGLSEGVEVSLGADERLDAALVAATRLRVEHTFPTADSLYLQLMGTWRDWFDVDSADLASGSAAFGAALRFGDLVVTPEAAYEALGFDDNLFLQQYGGSLAFDYTVNTALTLFAEIDGRYQDYDDDSPDDRDGWKYGGGGGIRAKPWEGNRLTARARYLRKEADDDAFAYDELELYLGDRQQLPRGQYLLAQAWYWHLVYDDPDPAVTATKEREDDRYKVRLAYGVPLRTAFGVVGVTLPAGIADIGFELSGSHYVRDSNIPNFDAENTSGQVLFTKNFAF